MMAKIKIYTTTTCPYCHQLKEYLKEKGMNFEEVVLNNHPDQVQTAIDICGSMGVPCIHITKDDGTEAKILGFDKEQVNLALGIQ
ncbi:NrdH-redoxin [Candidatus Roizmanbacteria bacterium]|nr:NrdH-redoxin [Candidatus Roizmanbacteria bacterium]